MTLEGRRIERVPGDPAFPPSEGARALVGAVADQRRVAQPGVERELTLAEVTPAMEPLRPLAAQVHAEALEAALAAGKALGV